MRIDGWLLVTDLALFVALGVITSWRLRTYLTEVEAVRLRAQAKPVIDRRTSQLGKQLLIPELAMILAEDLTNRDTSASIVDQNGRALAVGTPIEGPQPPLFSQDRYRAGLAGDPHSQFVVRDGSRRRMLVVLIPPRDWLPEVPALVQLAIFLRPLDRSIHTFLGILLGGAFAIFTGAVVLGAMFGGPYELISLLAIPLVGLAALLTPIRRESHVPGARSVQDQVLPAVTTEQPDPASIARHIEAAMLESQAVEERNRRAMTDAAHELRSPLTALKSGLDVITKAISRHPEQVERVGEVMRVQLDRMHRLVDDLMELSRLGSGPATVDQLVLLDQLVREQVAELQAASPDRRVRAVVEGEVAVAGDPDELRRALTKVTDNAIGHTQTEGLIEVGVRSQAGSAQLWVRDDGEGIPDHELGRVFDRFFRGEHSRQRQGSGLGLPICREIAERHGGSVSIESDVDTGTTVTIELALCSQNPTRAGSMAGPG